MCGPVSASLTPLQQQRGQHPEPSLCHPLPPHEVQLWSHQCKSSHRRGDPESVEKVSAKHWLRKSLQDCHFLPSCVKETIDAVDGWQLLSLQPDMKMETDECHGFHLCVSRTSE